MRARKHLLNFLIAAVLLAALAWTASGLDLRATDRIAVLFWLALCVGAECLWIRTPGGLATISMASCAHFAALLTLSRPEAMAVAGLGSAVAELFVLRKHWTRVVYNASQVACAVGIARGFLDATAGPGVLASGALAPMHLLALGVAATLYFLANHGATSLAVALDQGRSIADVWNENFGLRYEVFSSTALFCLGVLLAIQYQIAGSLGVIPLIIPVLLAKDGYDRFLASLTRKTPAGESRSRRPFERDPAKAA